MAMLKYVCLLSDLPAPVTVQDETVPVAELQKKQREKYQYFSPKKATMSQYANEHEVAIKIGKIGEIFMARDPRFPHC